MSTQGQIREKSKNVLLAAYPQRDEFRTFLFEKFDQNINEISNVGNITVDYFNVLEKFDLVGGLDQLLAKIYVDKWGNPQVANST